MRVWNWATTSKREAKDPAQRRRVRTPDRSSDGDAVARACIEF